jgi:hypothetical protein
LRNMSTTVSIGVESVTVIGAMSKIFLSFNGAGPRFWTGEVFVKMTSDWPVMPSNDLFSFAAEFKDQAKSQRMLK